MATTRGNVIRRGWWNNTPATADLPPYEFEDDDARDKPKTMDQLITDWENVRRQRIHLEGELIKVTDHEKRCVAAINEELKRLGVPRA